jgi:hypothetical protein
MDCERRPDVIICTDIGGKDPDDFQSMVHLLVYADLLHIVGLVSSPPYGGRTADILETIDCYEADYPFLQAHANYPRPGDLRRAVAQGALDCGAPAAGNATEGSRLIVEAARRIGGAAGNRGGEESASGPAGACRLWILVWGAMTDLAQALHDAPDIAPWLRVYSIGAWNTKCDPDARDYVFHAHPELWWVESDFTFRGIYQGGDDAGDLGNASFVEAHVAGHGALGRLFVEKKPTIKMSDSPSVLYLLSPLVGGVGDREDPTAASWGGSYRRDSAGPRYWTDIEESVEGTRGSISRYRKAYLRHWQRRMDRCRPD